MRDYEEILKSMRICLNVDKDSNCLSECFGCTYIDHDHHIMDMVRDGADAIEELLARLAAYEDTGLTPQEIEDCKEKWNKMSMRERLDTIAEPAELFPDRSKCVELDLEPGDLRNIVELFEDQFFEHLKFLLDEGDLDNIEYLRSMLRIYDQLRAAQAEEEA